MLPLATPLSLWCSTERVLLSCLSFAVGTRGSSIAEQLSIIDQPYVRGFFLGLFALTALYFIVAWWGQRDIRQLSLGLLSTAVSLQIIDAPQSTATTCILNGFLTFSLLAHFPQLFYVGPFARGFLRSKGNESPTLGPIPMWLRHINTLLIAANLVLSLFLPFLATNGGLSLLKLEVSSFAFLLPLLLLPAILMLLTLALQARRILLLCLIVLLTLAFELDMFGRVVGWYDVPAGYPLAFVFVPVFIVQVVFSMRECFAELEDGRRSMRHLTEQVEQRKDELKELMVKAQAASIAKTQFVSAVSHELRTPLTAIKGYTEILRDELGDVLQPVHDEFFDTIEISCDRLMSLVNDQLDMATVESGRIELTLTNVPLRPLIDEVVAQVFPIAQAKGLLLLRPRLDDEDARVHAESLRLRQVLINLLSNAIKFTERGCVGIRVYPCTVEGYAQTSYSERAYAIEVFDTGIGIAPDFIDKVFEPFAQEQRAYNNTQRGTGLGLSITRELIERMGGDISVESELGQGSKFTVRVVRADETKRLSPKGHRSEAPALPSARVAGSPSGSTAHPTRNRVPS